MSQGEDLRAESPRQETVVHIFLDIIAQMGEMKEIPITDLFTPSFMEQYSVFSSLDEMLNEAGIKNDVDYEEHIKSREWDLFIAEHTAFHTWRDMKEMALSVWITKMFKEKLEAEGYVLPGGGVCKEQVRNLLKE